MSWNQDCWNRLKGGGGNSLPLQIVADNINDFNPGGRLCPIHYYSPHGFGFTDLPTALWKFICVSFSLFWFCSDIIPFITLHGRDLWTGHCWDIEPRNRGKSLRLIWQRFSYLLDEWIAKISWWHDVNYLSIWPFMHHPWFPTRKASKLIFVCFQLTGEWHHPASWKQSHGHHPASWKQVNVSFQAFLVGNQGCRIKGQMLR